MSQLNCPGPDPMPTPASPKPVAGVSPGNRVPGSPNGTTAGVQNAARLKYAGRFAFVEPGFLMLPLLNPEQKSGVATPVKPLVVLVPNAVPAAVETNVSLSPLCAIVTPDTFHPAASLLVMPSVPLPNGRS